MTKTNADERVTERAGERDLDRLLDATLLEIARPPAVDLRARVLAGLDGRPQPERPWTLAAWRPAVALTSVAALLIGASVIWWQVTHQAGRDGQRPPAVASTAASRPSPGGAVVPVVAGAGTEFASNLPAAVEDKPARSGQRRPRSRYVLVEWPVEKETADAALGPHLPGAPAGELGDPMQPLPRRPPIAITPITVAPPISEISRPVTDFPASDSPPAAPTGEAAPTGGPRR